MLYGIFFEEINCAGDGGLYAELVRNRSFEDADKPEHWSLVTSGSAKGEMAIDTQRPMSPENPRSLRLKIAEVGDGRVGVANAGFWGIALGKDAVYELSFFARCGDGFKGPLVVTLESADGKTTYARRQVGPLTAEWQSFHMPLVSSASDPAAKLVISAAQAGTVWLDMVSLFPKDTWKGRLNGLRPDLAQMLADLRPAFVRFPGGCWVEGDTLEFAQRWKKTIGDVANRRNQWNIWHYFSTNGLGYHEYLQMCEDLKAEPLFVINCGMSHKEVVPLDKMGEWVQDALDAIEYANGPVDSKWGSLRAKAGHPAPFNLKYLEIGNENGGPAYQERYALFYDAIKARYPQITLIADVRTSKRPTEILDEHYYSSPEFFISHAHKYDTYDRKGPKIYVGEYAVTAGAGQGNLRAAVGEAAFMTGMERNSDVVVMASYAPLLANVNHKRWNPDLINFDSSRVFGTPAYHVQKMFSVNRPDVVLPVTLEFAAPAAPPQRHGAVGLGTWNTQAEFKDVRVTQGEKTLLASDFAKDSAGWKPGSGDWKVQDGALRQSAGGDDRRITTGDPAWSDYTYSLKARKLGGAEGFLIMFHVQNHDHWVWWNLGGWGNSRHALERCEGGKSILGNEVRGRIETGRWYDIRIELKGQEIRCYLDGKLLHDVEYAQIKPLYAVAGRANSSSEIVLKVVNVSQAACETQIELKGAGRIQPAGQAIVLTSAKPNDENTLAEPTKVAPVARAIENVGPSFRQTFPPNSVTVLRLTTAP
jgi:alpha-L-arabinofuranosidase